MPQPSSLNVSPAFLDRIFSPYSNTMLEYEVLAKTFLNYGWKRIATWYFEDSSMPNITGMSQSRIWTLRMDRSNLEIQIATGKARIRRIKQWIETLTTKDCHLEPLFAQSDEGLCSLPNDELIQNCYNCDRRLGKECGCAGTSDALMTCSVCHHKETFFVICSCGVDECYQSQIGNVFSVQETSWALGRSLRSARQVFDVSEQGGVSILCAMSVSHSRRSSVQDLCKMVNRRLCKNRIKKTRVLRVSEKVPSNLPPPHLTHPNEKAIMESLRCGSTCHGSKRTFFAGKGSVP